MTPLEGHIHQERLETTPVVIASQESQTVIFVTGGDLLVQCQDCIELGIYPTQRDVDHLVQWNRVFKHEQALCPQYWITKTKNREISRFNFLSNDFRREGVFQLIKVLFSTATTFAWNQYPSSQLRIDSLVVLALLLTISEWKDFFLVSFNGNIYVVTSNFFLL